MLLWGCILASGVPARNSSAGDASAALVTFKEPQWQGYVLDVTTVSGAARKAGDAPWIEARQTSTGRMVWLGHRLALHLDAHASLERLLEGRRLVMARHVAPGLFILDAGDAATAVREASDLSRMPGVLACHPVMHKQRALHGPYAPPPADPYFPQQWNLESRDANGALTGVDLNVRSAWPRTTGRGVVIAVADTGIEFSHPDLSPRAATGFHRDFFNGTSDPSPVGASGEFATHGTSVAGLAAADGENRSGMIGVAPGAGLASWRIFSSGGHLANQEQLMDMFQAHSNVVAVQNHSWGEDGLALDGPSVLELAGISNAITLGRDGRGVIMVRAAGNGRLSTANANDDAYVSDPRVIAVAAAMRNGRAASYSEPGACVMIAAPVHDHDGSGLFTTDLVGTRGVNQVSFMPPDETLNDFRFASLGFTGTSAAAPQIAGVAALMLSANPNLHWRDVQQILMLSARHADLADPDLRTNAAGFVISHNVGFGIPDAGEAVRLAETWVSRPPPLERKVTNSTPVSINDAGALLLVNADGLEGQLSIPAAPGTGRQPPTPFPAIPLVDVGTANDPVSVDLTGKGALIQRGTTTFSNKVANAAAAGAVFAVVYNNTEGTASAPGGEHLFPMAGLDYSPIPAVFIRQSAGDSLVSLLSTQATATATMGVQRSIVFMNVDDSLLVEHVSLRVTTDHPQRGDLRITLTSPHGTTSVLQHYNADTQAGPNGWTYHSVRHLGESAAGTWFVAVSDAFPGNSGGLQELVLSIRGVPIVDTDRDGLDDAWEQMHFSTLAQGPRDDADGDGFSNAREQLMGTSPVLGNRPFQLDLSVLRNGLVRLSWPGLNAVPYQVNGGPLPDQILPTLTNLSGRFPETEIILNGAAAQNFFRVLRSAP